MNVDNCWLQESSDWSRTQIQNATRPNVASTHRSRIVFLLVLFLVVTLLGIAEAQAVITCKQDSPAGNAECMPVQLTPWQYTTSGSWEGSPSWTPPAYSEDEAIRRMDQYLANYFSHAYGFCRNVWVSNNVDWVVTRSDHGISIAEVRTNAYTVTSYYIQPPSQLDCDHPRQTQNIFRIGRGRQDYCPGGWTPWADASNHLFCMREDTPPCPSSCSNTSPFASSGAQAAAAGGYVGNPVFAENGDKSLDETDFATGGPYPLKLHRRYLSTGFVWQYKTPPPTFAFGPYWRSDFDQRLYAYQGSTQNTMIAYRADGAVLYFYQNGSTWTPRAEQAERLSPLMSGGIQIGWQLTTGGNDVESYDLSGRLTSLTRVGGWIWTLAYNGAGQLASVTDGFGRQLTFSYNAAGLVSQIIAPDGGLYGYAYDVLFNNLTSVSYPNGTQKQYMYNEPTNTTSGKMGLLTGVLDENGTRYATYKYNSVGQATSTEHAGGVEKYTIASNQSSHHATVTDPLGTARGYSYAAVLGVTRFTGVYPPCVGCAQGISYDVNGNVAYSYDFNNKKTCYANDLTRNLETQRVEGALSTENCTTVLATLPSRVDVRKVSTQWHGIWRLPIRIAEPNRITTNTYNGDGGVYCAPTTALAGGNPIGVLCKKTVQADH